jgi:hypothetical protein
MNLRAAALLSVASSTAGCHGCHDGHPYVPYAIESAFPAVRAPDAGSAAATAPDAGGPAFVGVAATIAPSGVARWSIDGVVLEAPDGQVFVSAVVRDFDGDGAKDAFAIVRASDGNDPGGLAFYRGLEHADALRAPTVLEPPPLPRDPGCSPMDRLTAIGPRSVLAELGMTQCPVQPSKIPDRWVAVVRGGSTATVRLAVTIADPQGAGALSVEGDTVDRDADGLDDVALRIALGGASPRDPAPRVTAIFTWLDRSAGLSRDLAVTESSFASLAATAAARAVRHKDAPELPAYAAQVRALWRAVCAEGGSPRVTGVGGTGAIACGTGRALENLGLAEARGYVTAGDPLRAALALDRVEHSASHGVPRLSEAQKWIEQVAPPASAVAVRGVGAIPVIEAGREPAWGPLAFEPGGKQLVRTRAGVVRIDPDAGDEAAADGVADWKSAVTSPDGALRWVDTTDPCDGLSLRATFALAAGDDLHEVALPVWAPLGDRCVGLHGARARTLPIAWGPQGVEAIVDGEPVLISPDLGQASPHLAVSAQPTTLGSPRSPDGSLLVLSTAAGLLVRDATQSRLLRAPELEGTYGEQRDCAVSNGATHVACVHVGRAWVGTWEGRGP